MDATGSVFAPVIFTVLIFIGSFYLLNLTLAVLGDNFQKEKDATEAEESKKEREKARDQAARLLKLATITPVEKERESFDNARRNADAANALAHFEHANVDEHGRTSSPLKYSGPPPEMTTPSGGVTPIEALLDLGTPMGSDGEPMALSRRRSIVRSASMREIDAQVNQKSITPEDADKESEELRSALETKLMDDKISFAANMRLSIPMRFMSWWHEPLTKVQIDDYGEPVLDMNGNLKMVRTVPSRRGHTRPCASHFRS